MSRADDTPLPLRAPAPPRPASLLLDANEGPAPDPVLLEGLAADPVELLRRYPDASDLEARLAREFDLSPGRVLVTAGADEALERFGRARLAPGAALALPDPTFGEIARAAAAVGAPLRRFGWEGGPFPLQAALDACAPDVAALALVSPNNPTGAVLTADDLHALSAARPGVTLLVDLAYGEFADVDLTAAALALPDVVVLRTFSKAWGLAGARVGFALGAPGMIASLREAGAPYSVSTPSLLLARRWRDRGEEWVARGVARVKQERRTLARLLTQHGFDVEPSQANFVFARGPRAAWLADGLAGLGVAVRRFVDRPDAVRISCPAEPSGFRRLLDALEAVLAPEALLLDMDGVIVDVSRSYRRAIVETAAGFGVDVSGDQIAAMKRAGDANDDYEVTRRLVCAAGVAVAVEDVVERFDARYLGCDGDPGLIEQETLLVSRDVLEALAARLPLAVVTGRPRRDAERALDDHGLRGVFAEVICREDAPCKPDPAPVRLAMERLGVERAWMVGDTRDDVVAARAAGAVPLGVVAPGDDAVLVVPNLLEAGAAEVLTDLEALTERLEPGR